VKRRKEPMRFLLSSPLLWAYEPGDVLAIAFELGYAGVELWAYHILRDNAEPAKLRREAERLGLDLSLHTLSWDLNPCSPLEAIRLASVSLLEESIAIAAALGATIAVMHPGRSTVPHQASDEYWPLLAHSLQFLAQRAEEAAVTLAIEHMEPIRNEFVVRPADMQRLLAAVNHPNLRVAFDLAHVPWEEDPVAYFESMPQVGHLHLSDADAQHYHLPLGNGQRDLGRFLTHIKQRYRGFIVVEGIEHQRTTALAASNKKMCDQLTLERDAYDVS
jgi:sugar phosphate isomerase/epimerase